MFPSSCPVDRRAAEKRRTLIYFSCWPRDRIESGQSRENQGLCVSRTLNINSHGYRAGDMLPAGALPEFSAAKVVVGHQDYGAHHTGCS